MRWQRSAFAALRRWVDLTQGAQLRLVPELVVPTVSLGEDRPDNERAHYHLAAFQAATPAQVNVIEVIPVVGSMELVAAWCSRSGGPFNAGMAFAPTPIPPTLGTQIAEQTGPGGPNGIIRFNSFAPPWGVLFEAPADTTIQLPVRGVVVDPGVAFAFGGAIVNQGISLGVLVRNVGGP